MKQKDSLQIHNDYLVLHLTGEALPPDKILEEMKKVCQLCKEKDLLGGIIYRTEATKQKASVLDFYQFSEFLASQQLFGYKFALVFPKEEQENKIDFLKTASVNRGVNFERFDTYEKAVKWVTEE